MAMTMTNRTEMDILRESAQELAENDRLRKVLRASDERILALCREFDTVSRSWGYQPYHLRNACVARGLLEE